MVVTEFNYGLFSLYFTVYYCAKVMLDALVFHFHYLYCDPVGN